LASRKLRNRFSKIAGFFECGTGILESSRLAVNENNRSKEEGFAPA
jgi:hypothetical protein